MINRKFLSKTIALIVGLLCLYIAYTHNLSKTFTFKGYAYGTSWSITTLNYLNDVHKSNIKDLAFALGKIYEDIGEYEKSFKHIKKANNIYNTTIRIFT